VLARAEGRPRARSRRQRPVQRRAHQREHRRAKACRPGDPGSEAFQDSLPRPPRHTDIVHSPRSRSGARWRLDIMSSAAHESVMVLVTHHDQHVRVFCRHESYRLVMTNAVTATRRRCRYRSVVRRVFLR
jgi:hypothetical protein